MGVNSYIYYKIPYDMIFPDLAPKWVIPVWKQPETFAINNCGAIYNYCKHVRGTSLVSSPFPIRYRTLLISEKKLIYVKERWQFFFWQTECRKCHESCQEKIRQTKNMSWNFLAFENSFFNFFLFCNTQVTLRMELYIL